MPPADCTCKMRVRLLDTGGVEVACAQENCPDTLGACKVAATQQAGLWYEGCLCRNSEGGFAPDPNCACLGLDPQNGAPLKCDTLNCDNVCQLNTLPPSGIWVDACKCP